MLMGKAICEYVIIFREILKYLNMQGKGKLTPPCPGTKSRLFTAILI